MQSSLRTVSDQYADHQKNDEARRQREELQKWLSIDDLGVIDPAHLADREPPQREWMIEDCFAKGTVALVAGDGGIGKSLLMQQLASSAVMGRDWLGKRLLSGKALLLACEDDRDELWRRQDGINRHLGISMLDLKEQGLQLWPRVGQDNTLMALDRATWKMAGTHWFERVKLRCLRDGITYLIVDTATQTFRGNQNDETQVMDYITEMRRLAVAMQGLVIITKHPSMAGRALGTGESGNVAWSNGVRARAYMQKDKSGQLGFRLMKANYGPVDVDISIKWERGVYVLDKPDPIEDLYYKRY